MSAPAEPRPWRRALAWLLFLGPFFFASYGLATWVTGQRNDVGVVVFSWERHIPFLPWTIVPYWLIDGLYGISLFLCATRAELDRHGRRLLTAQVVAVSCFLLFPLRFSFERGPVDGPFGWLFATLESFDQPYNQAPSLHIALMVLLWGVYLRALPRAWHGLVHGLFALIGVSVLTTWQHHFIDLPTGLLLGWGCLWLIPDEAEAPLARVALPRDPARRRLACRYGLGALLLAGPAVAFGGAALWLFWPALSLILVSAAYLCLGPAAFQKRPDGSVTPATRWLLGPYFLGAWLNSRAWTRKLPAAAAVAPGLLLGRLPGRADPERLGLAAIVDLTAELPCPAGGRAYVNVPMLDLIPPDTDQLERAAEAIRTAHARHAESGPVLVCCALGFSRSALAVAAWLLATDRAATPDRALAQVRTARPAVVLGPAQRAVLEEWWEWHRSSKEADAASATTRRGISQEKRA